MQLIRTGSSRRLEWWWFHPYTTTGCRDIQRNINNSAFNIYVTAPITVSLNISASRGRRKMKPPPFDAARRDGSNELRYILLRPLDAEIISGTCLYTKGDQIRRYDIYIFNYPGDMKV